MTLKELIVEKENLLDSPIDRHDANKDLKLINQVLDCIVRELFQRSKSTNSDNNYIIAWIQIIDWIKEQRP